MSNKLMRQHYSLTS